MTKNWTSLNTESPEFLFKNWVNSEEKTLEDFLIWLEYEHAGEDTSEEEDRKIFESVKKLADIFVGYHPEKIKAGEAEALKKWKESVTGYRSEELVKVKSSKKYVKKIK